MYCVCSDEQRPFLSMHQWNAFQAALSPTGLFATAKVCARICGLRNLLTVKELPLSYLDLVPSLVYSFWHTRIR